MKNFLGKYATIYKLVFIMLISAFIISILIGYDKYDNVRSIDLSKESIAGISLMEKYDSKQVDQILGENVTATKSKVNNSINYEYLSKNFIVELVVDMNNNITKISMVTSIKNDIKTSKGISNSSSFEDIINSYGENYLREKRTDFMGSGNGYSITYIDKDSHHKIRFEFNQDSKKEQMTNMELFMY